MLNFAVGPVMMEQSILNIGAEQIPYFRTEKFSAVMKQNDKLICELLNAPRNSCSVFMTGSGTASMEASVLNTLTRNDKAIIVNGGSFGARFCEICDVHEIPYDEIKCEAGKTLTASQLSDFDGKNYTAFIFNLCETSTGVLYDLNLISDFCKRNKLFLIVDAVSAFLCDKIDMTANAIDVLITGSQKALGLAPGLSIMCFSENALNRINANNINSFYFDLKKYLADGKRGQTPFTPAVGVILQLNKRLNNIISLGGIENELQKARHKAEYFRASIRKLPLQIFADECSNSVTSLTITKSNKSAYKLFELLMNEYGIFVCPNGGNLKEKVFRVGHMGDLCENDYDKLVNALSECLLSEKINCD